MNNSPMDGLARRKYAALLWALTVSFGLRVVGQAIQYWNPVMALPAFESFQGSNLDYGLLLSIQVGILLLMGWFAYKVNNASLRPDVRKGLLIIWIGWIYMAGSIGRILIGLIIDGAHPWFSTWIPAVFHLVLAAYLLLLAYYHITCSNPSRGGK